MSGWSQNKGSTRPADVLFRNVAARSPLPTVIVTNETCSAQYAYLQQKLSAAPYNYHSAANWSLPHFGQPNCTTFGNTIFWRGTTAQDGISLYTYSTQANPDPNAEQRNMICVSFSTLATSSTPATPVRVCGTHLHQDDAISTPQLSEAKTLIDGYNGSGPATLLVGDLNMTPGVSAFDDWYNGGNYAEADLSGRARPRPTTTSNIKLDYGFVPTATTLITSTARIDVQIFSSDHSIYTTNFGFKS